MRVLLVDDEPLALMQLKNVLERSSNDIEVVGMYKDPEQVPDQAARLNPDVIFLDIQMGGMNGLQLGEQLQQLMPRAELVFVTAYNQYAVQAFELYAADYIMKPVHHERMQKTILHLQKRNEHKLADKSRHDSEHSGQMPRICCFGALAFEVGDIPSRTTKWRTRKAQELFAYLLHYRNRLVERDVIIEMLWPDFDTVRASQQLYTTIYHIRKTLQSLGFEAVRITSNEAGYTLDLGETEIDIEQWEQQAERLGEPHHKRLQDYERVLELYKGHYLGELEYPWAEHERERLRRLWLKHAYRLGQLYQERGLASEVIKLLLRIQKFQPYEEDTYFSLMKLYSELGDDSGVQEQYELLLSSLCRDLEVPVSEFISNWYASWCRKKDLHALQSL